MLYKKDLWTYIVFYFILRILKVGCWNAGCFTLLVCSAIKKLMVLVSILINHWMGMQTIEKKYFCELWFINCWIRLCRRYFEIKIFWQHMTSPFSGTAKACWWSTLTGNFSLTLLMKILDDIAVLMSGLLLVEAIRMAGPGRSALDYIAAKTLSPSKQMSPPSSSKGRDHRDVKKLCRSQDPVKQNSRCAAVSNNWLLQIFWLCSLSLYFQVRARNRWTSHWRGLFGREGRCVK